MTTDIAEVQRKTLLERVQANVVIDPVTGCWLWRRGLTSDGYAALWVGGKNVRGHRALWLELHGPLGRWEFVCHRCDRPSCCNPAHLFVGTNADNMRDKIAKGRQPRGERAGGARLTAAQVREIRAQPGMHRRIAAFYGISDVQVSRIKRRENWEHVS